MFRLQATTTAGVVSTYNYDPFGRLNTVTADGQTSQRYVYDGFDRIIEQTTDGTITRKTYDPLDRTATETTDVGGPDEETTLFAYLGLTNQVLTEHVGGQVTTSYQHGAGGEMLSQTKHDTTGSGTDENSFYGYNPHGDITAITDETGDSRATYGYTAYGSDDESLFTGVDQPDPGDPAAQEPYNAYRYAGQRFDAATGTYDMGFRDYSPGLNRFLSRDMFNGALADMNLGSNPWTLGRYTFAGGNPTTLVEYDGHVAVREIDGGGGGESLNVPPMDDDGSQFGEAWGDLPDCGEMSCPSAGYGQGLKLWLKDIISAAWEADIDPRLLLTVLVIESADDRTYDQVSAALNNSIPDRFGKPSVGMANMQQDTFVETVLNRPGAFGLDAQANETASQLHGDITPEQMLRIQAQGSVAGIRKR